MRIEWYRGTQPLGDWTSVENMIEDLRKDTELKPGDLLIVKPDKPEAPHPHLRVVP